MRKNKKMKSYNKISKLFHWVMVVAFLWQFLAISLSDKHTTMGRFFWETHKPIGFIILLLAILRIIWSLLTLKSRPERYNEIAHWGHLVLYIFMILVPIIGLLGQYGSGKGFVFLGISIFETHSYKIQWMVETAKLLHGFLGWTFMVLILGHIFMAFYHYYKKDKKFFKRIL